MSKHKENNGENQNQDFESQQQGQNGQKGQKANQGSEFQKGNGGSEQQKQQSKAQQESQKAIEEQNKRAAQAAPQFTQEQIEQAESQEGDDLEMKGITNHGVDASSAHDMTKRKMQQVQDQMARGNRPQSNQGFENFDKERFSEFVNNLESDEQKKQEFKNNPKAMLEKEGIKLPEGVEVYESSEYDKEQRNQMHSQAANEPRQQKQEMRVGKYVLVKS